MCSPFGVRCVIVENKVKLLMCFFYVFGCCCAWVGLAGKTYRATFDYGAEQEDELTLKQGGGSPPYSLWLE